MDLFKRLALLTDDRAKVVARIAAEAKLAKRKDLVCDKSGELRAAIQDAFDVGTVPAGSSEEIVVARHALVFLAETDPATVERCLKASTAESVLGLIALVTVGLVILQTKVKIKRSDDGKWSIDVEKNAASEEFIKGYVKSMLGLWK